MHPTDERSAEIEHGEKEEPIPLKGAESDVSSSGAPEPPGIEQEKGPRRDALDAGAGAVLGIAGKLGEALGDLFSGQEALSPRAQERLAQRDAERTEARNAHQETAQTEKAIERVNTQQTARQEQQKTDAELWADWITARYATRHEREHEGGREL
jgi:hypothetical protein